ncbi:hypothetical protein BDZ97DRAFT_1900798 [Flammula alnicola]|nr:hypothetical protein BDZ97DRAFT_1900798 [Flammula alnicola]
MPAANVLLRFRSNELASFINSHRVFFYTFVSLVSVSAVIINALKNYSNFYSVAIYLSKSSRSVWWVLANFGILLALLCGHIVQRIFFGSLRPNEVERLYDRLWFFITESLLAFTIFRDEFDTPFALMFGFLLFVKSFHWLASDRIEWMDQRPYPGPPLLFHFRMTVLFAVLWITDCIMFLFAVEHTLTAGVGGMVLFASEYGILMASVMNTILKYLLSTYDLRRAGRRGGENAPPWENKSMWIFYIELATDFLKLTTYLVFFIIIITFYGLPLNIVRDVYITARSFVTRLRALHRYQTATRNMDQRYPNATEEELSGMSDRTCIICREEMVSPGTQESQVHPEGPNTTPKKLPCGHIFHFYCLRSWLERQQSCPTCRRNVLETTNTATQPAAGGVPVHPPNPAGGPQQQANPLAPADVQNAQGGGNNNPLGFLGRFFGPPARPGNPAPNRQGIQNQGQAGGQGIFINYQVQYQFPRQNDGNVQPTHQPQHPQQGLPIPPYPGFPGPGGVWQPWPADEVVNAAVDVPAEAGISDGTPTTTSSENISQDLSHSDVTGTESTTSTFSQASSSSSQEQNESPSPREAAARAALNRLGIKTPVDVNPKVSPSTSANVDTPVASTSTSTAGLGQASKTAVSGIQPPKLIPLYDFRSEGSTSRASIPRDAGVQQGNNGNFASLLQHVQRPTNILSTPRFAQTPASSSSAFVREPQQSYTNTLPSQLPPTLTDEQLATLDVLTRESIDERLRILEGVSGAVYRCIDDLMRLRSALPPLNVPTATATTNNPVPASSTAPQASSIEPAREAATTHGKEKMREVHPETLESQPSSSSTEEET